MDVAHMDGVPAVLLRSSPVARGDLFRRVLCTPRFISTVALTAIICAGVQVLVGWLLYTCWGRCAFPAANETSAYACLDSPLPDDRSPEQGVNLVRTIFIDAILTAFFTSGAQLPQRINDVRHGRLPLVQSHAFPRGWVMHALFPPCRKSSGSPATRHDHGRNFLSWASLTLIWGVGWGALSLVALELLHLVRGRNGEPLCLAPIVFIAVRAVWTSIEAVLVASGSYILWSTRGDEIELPLPGVRSLPGGATRVGMTAVKPGLREPLASPTASAYLPVD